MESSPKAGTVSSPSAITSSSRAHRQALRQYYQGNKLVTSPNMQTGSFGEANRSQSVLSSRSSLDTDNRSILSNRRSLQRDRNFSPSRRSLMSAVDFGDLDSVTGKQEEISINFDNPEGEKFDEDKFIDEILQKASLGRLLSIQNQLSTEVQSLQSEQKSLVYDNYYKLITASDSLRTMKEDMSNRLPDSEHLKSLLKKISNSAEKLNKIPESLKKSISYPESESHKNLDSSLNVILSVLHGTKGEYDVNVDVKQLEELIGSLKREEDVYLRSQLESFLEKINDNKTETESVANKESTGEIEEQSNGSAETEITH